MAAAGFLAPARDFSASKRLRDESAIADNSRADAAAAEANQERKAEFLSQCVGAPMLTWAEGFVVDTSKAAFESDGTQETYILCKTVKTQTVSHKRNNQSHAAVAANKANESTTGRASIIMTCTCDAYNLFCAASK